MPPKIDIPREWLEACHSKTNSNRWHWFGALHNWWLDQPEINFAFGSGLGWSPFTVKI